GRRSTGSSSSATPNASPTPAMPAASWSGSPRSASTRWPGPRRSSRTCARRGPAAWVQNGCANSRPTCARWARTAGSPSTPPPRRPRLVRGLGRPGTTGTARYPGRPAPALPRSAGPDLPPCSRQRTGLIEDGRVTTDTGSAAPEPQAVIAPLTGAAIFLVVVLNPGEDSADRLRGLCADLAGLVRAVGFRDLEGHLSCGTGFGVAAWDRIAGPDKPAGLHPFREIKAGPRHAVATPGDVLFHIRATRMDLCFELATQIIT